MNENNQWLCGKCKKPVASATSGCDECGDMEARVSLDSRTHLSLRERDFAILCEQVYMQSYNESEQRYDVSDEFEELCTRLGVSLKHFSR